MKKVLVMLVCLITPMCWAASGCDGSGNCYVRAGATGSGNGSDWTNAYTDLPANLMRGVTYYVAAGLYKSHTFRDADSGSTVITIQAATTTSHGTSTGWSNSYQGQATFSAPITFATDYYSLSGVYRSTATGNPETDWTLESGYGFKVDNSDGHAGTEINGGSGYGGATCASVSACNAAGMFVHDITVSYVDVNGAHPSSDTMTIDNSVDFEGGSYNLIFSHLYVHDDAVPFFLKGSHNHQAGGGYYFGTGDGNTVEYTYVKHNYSSPAYHSEGCSCSEGLTNFTWRYNYTDQIGGVGGNGSTAHIGTASGADYNNGNGPNGPWYIYGNVFTCTSTTSTMNCAVGDGVLAVWDASFTGAIYFLNNTTYNLGLYTPEAGFGFGLGYTTPMTAVYAENNLFYGNDPMTVIPTGATNWNGTTFSTAVIWSYNAYFNTPTAGNGDPDPHKQVAAINPFSGGGICCSLASATTAGISTSSLVPGNNVDMFGFTRGADGTWDRGAFEFSSSVAQSPAPPTGVLATVQ